MPKTSDLPSEPKEPAWIPPTIHLDTKDASKLLNGTLPGMDQVVTVTAKVTGIEKGTSRDYDTGKTKPRQSVTLEVQSIEGGEEPEMEGVMGEDEQDETLGYKRSRATQEAAPDVGPLTM
jgi:hypothetical protein